jgi:AcrR family transcriptional regulator
MNNATKPRERILQVATDLFYQRGIHAVGVDEIVARSGAAKTTLYAHFPSKDELVAAYLRRWSEIWRGYVEHELAISELSPAEQIDLVFKLLANGCDSSDFRGCPFSNAAAEFPDPTHPARVVGDAHRAWVRALFARLSHEANARDPELLADWLALLYDASMIGAHLEPASGAQWKARSAARALVDSMLAPAGEAAGDLDRNACQT